MSKGDVQGSFQNFEHVFCTYATNKVIRQIFVTRQNFGTVCLRSFVAETFLDNATKNNLRGTPLSITHHNLLLMFLMLFFILRRIPGDSYVWHENNIQYYTYQTHTHIYICIYMCVHIYIYILYILYMYLYIMFMFIYLCIYDYIYIYIIYIIYVCMYIYI